MYSDVGIKTTNGQYLKLLSLLSDRQDIAHGITRRSKDELGTFWVYVANELNYLGPPIKDPIAWRKVWSDYKSYVKKKLVQNKKEIEVTDGKPRKLHFLNSIEQKVVRISGLEKHIKLIDNKVIISFEEGRLGPPGANESTPGMFNLDLLKKPEMKNLSNISFEKRRRKKKNDLNIFSREDSVENSLEDPSEQSDFNSLDEDDIELNFENIKISIVKQDDATQELAEWVKKSERNSRRMKHTLRKLIKGLYRLYIVNKCILREKIRHNREVEKIMKRKLKISEHLLEQKQKKLHQSINVPY